MMSLRIVVATFLLAIGWIPALTAAQSTPEATRSTPESETGPQFLLHPLDQNDGSYFTLEAEPGSTHTLTAVIGNVDDEPLSLRTYAGDAFTLVNGGFGVREEGDPVEGVGAWIDYPAETLDFAPGDGLRRSGSVAVAEDPQQRPYLPLTQVPAAKTLGDQDRAVHTHRDPLSLPAPGPALDGILLGHVLG